MPTPLKVLIVEDSRAGVAAVLDELERGGYEVRHAQVETAEDMRAALERDDWNVVLANYSMPRFSAPEALKVLRASGRELPFIIISDISRRRDRRCRHQGRRARLSLKGRLDHLVPAIEREH